MPARWAPWLILAALCLLVRLPLLEVPLDRDEGAFGLVGQSILRGELPYRDIFDHKPPGVFYLYAAALAALPASAAGIHAFLALWNLGGLAAVASLAGLLAGRRAALWTGLLYAVLSAAPSVQGYAASSEMLLLPPLAASLCLCVAALRGPPRGRTALLVLSGLLAGVAFWIKQPAAVALLVTPLLIVKGGGGERGQAGPLRGLLSWLGGLCAAVAAVIVPFWLAGAWREFWYWSFQHSALYGGRAWGEAAGWLAEGLVKLAPDLGPALLAGLAGALLGRGSGRNLGWVAPAFLACSALSLFHSPFFYAHYFALLVPAATLWGGIGLARLQAICRERLGPRAGLAFTLLAALFCCATPAAVRPWYWLNPDPAGVSLRLLGAQAFDAAPLLAAHVAERSGPEETIFVHGSEPQIALLAGRREANPFVMAYPWTGPWPRQREFQERVWERLRELEPVYVLRPTNPLSLLRDPDVDRFLDRRIVGLLRNEYRLEARLLYDPPRGLRLDLTAAPQAPGPAPALLFEVWRRRAAPGG